METESWVRKFFKIVQGKQRLFQLQQLEEYVSLQTHSSLSENDYFALHKTAVKLGAKPVQRTLDGMKAGFWQAPKLAARKRSRRPFEQLPLAGV